MSVIGKTLDGIQSTLLTGLVGTTLTGTGSPSITVTLTAGDDERDPAIGPPECADGGVSVWYAGGSTTGSNAPNSSGGLVQRFWEHTYRVRVTVNVAGFSGDRINANIPSLVRQLINAIEAILEPQSGVNFNVMREAIREPTRHPQFSDYYLIETAVSVREAWARS